MFLKKILKYALYNDIFLSCHFFKDDSKRCKVETSLGWVRSPRLNLFLICKLTALHPMGFPGGSEVKASAWNAGVWSLGREDPLEKKMATHSSTLAWRIPWMEEHGRLQFMGSQRVGHDWATSLSPSALHPRVSQLIFLDFCFLFGKMRLT